MSQQGLQVAPWGEGCFRHSKGYFMGGDGRDEGKGRTMGREASAGLAVAQWGGEGAARTGGIGQPVGGKCSGVGKGE